MELNEKACYIQGLIEGMNVNDKTPEGKIITELATLVAELSKEVVALRADMTDAQTDIDSLNDYADELDADLADVEDYLDELDAEEEDACDGDCDNCDEEECPYDEDEADCDGDCCNCSLDCPYSDEGEDEDEDEEDDGDYYEIVCPACGETVCFDGTLDPENLVCPACGEKFGCIVDEEDYKKIAKDEQ